MILNLLRSFRDNHIGPKGLDAFVNALKENPSLIKVEYTRRSKYRNQVEQIEKLLDANIEFQSIKKVTNMIIIIII